MMLLLLLLLMLMLRIMCLCRHADGLAPQDVDSEPDADVETCRVFL